MAEVFRWPAEMTAKAVSFNPRGQTVGGPVSLTGQSQVASIDAGYWMASVDLSILEKGDDINSFRALRAEMEGGAHHLLVPAFDQGQAPWVNAGGFEANENDELTWSDAELWSDGVGWYYPAIRIYMAQDGALRDTSIVVDIDAAGTLKAGMLFSLLGGGLHVIKRVLAVNGTERTLAIWPPLRAAAPAGRRCNFEKPVCKMRLVSEQDADLSLSLLWMAAPSMSFIEVF